MAGLAFALLLVFLAATGVVWGASELTGQGYQWADQVCSTARNLCEHPYWGILATIAAGAMYFLAETIHRAR